jgi:hypothetical protein
LPIRCRQGRLDSTNVDASRLQIQSVVQEEQPAATEFEEQRNDIKDDTGGESFHGNNICMNISTSSTSYGMGFGGQMNRRRGNRRVGVECG